MHIYIYIYMYMNMNVIFYNIHLSILMSSISYHFDEHPAVWASDHTFRIHLASSPRVCRGPQVLSTCEATRVRGPKSGGVVLAGPACGA